MPRSTSFPPNWPAPADRDAAARLRGRFASLGAAANRAAMRPSFAAMLDCLGGNSPYLADLALREERLLRSMAAFGADTTWRHVLHQIAAITPDMARDRVAAGLRQAKRRGALLIALADLCGYWDLAQVTLALSDLAERSLQAALSHLLHGAQTRDELYLPDPAHPMRDCGFVVLGMGKLGAHELNYSSDIDLILLYDPEPHAYHADLLPGIFSRLARNLVQLMDARDANGYVFRTDLRLRPNPGATPPAISLPAALTYYESMGQGWERAAMIKARPLAGDLALGDRFLREIRPFIWRKQLDFAAIADLRQMKQRIDARTKTQLPQGGAALARLAGYDVKIGQGGIREIEFIVQTLQLIWGGRDPALRQTGTLQSAQDLLAAGHLSRRAAGELALAYRFLRQVEHRIQMVADQQTHRLPDFMPQIERFAIFMGYPKAEPFARHLLRHMRRVRGQFTRFFHEADAPTSPDKMEDPATLTAWGYRDPAHVLQLLRHWRSGDVRALRSDRARDLLNAMLPSLLQALAQPSGEPDQALTRFDQLLSRLPAGVQLLSLLAHNQSLLNRLAVVLNASPLLADHLARSPAALEGLLAPHEISPDPLAALRGSLRDAATLEDDIAIIRDFVRGEEFRLSVLTLEGGLDIDDAGPARTALADAVITLLLERVSEVYTARHGAPPGSGLAVIALGKAGGQDMMAGSDLDLMLIYDPRPAGEDEGAEDPQYGAASEYYIRLAHGFIAALTAPGVDGPLYAVDMRLRPSGNKGPVAVALPGFINYNQGTARNWERMALTRARIVTGPPKLCAAIEAAIDTALHNAMEDATRLDATAMRARLLRDMPPRSNWDIRLRAGGLQEVEFIVQTTQLITKLAAPRPHTTRETITRLQNVGALTPEDCAFLQNADHVWRVVQSILRTATITIPKTMLPPALLTTLGEALDWPDADIATHLDNIATQVRACFIRLIGDPTSININLK